MSDVRDEGECPDVFWQKKNNFFLADKDGNVRSVFFLLLHPMSLLLSGLVVFFFITWRKSIISLPWGNILAFVLPVLAVYIIFLIASVIIRRISSASLAGVAQEVRDEQARKATEVSARKRRAKEVAKYARLEATRNAWKDLYTGELPDIVCCNGDGSPLPVRFDALPPRRRTIFLRFQHVKARVCRPFARR